MTTDPIAAYHRGARSYRRRQAWRAAAIIGLAGATCGMDDGDSNFLTDAEQQFLRTPHIDNNRSPTAPAILANTRSSESSSPARSIAH